MTTPPPPPVSPILDVTGGSGGLAAQYAEAEALGDRFARSVDQQGDWAAHSRSVAADPDLAESGVLSPVTCARAEAAVLETVVALKLDQCAWQATVWAIRVAIAMIADADRVAQVGMDAMDYQLDRDLGFVVARLPWATGWTVLGIEALWHPREPRDEVLTDHPGLVRHLMNGSGGLLDGLGAGLGLPLPVLLSPRLRDAARLAAATYGDEGRPVVNPVRLDVPGGTRQPGSVEDLVAHLAGVAQLSHGSGSPLNGTIEVQTITAADGQVRHVVYLPGTDDLTTTPFSQDQDVRDMATNAQLMAGEQDTYQQGILQALHDAGIKPGDPVALVGHSQGGMEAVALLAHHSTAAGDPHGFDITDVVTAGSPTAQVGSFPDGSQVLSLEQRGDIVPVLDGRDPQDCVAQTTVRFDAGPDGGVLAHHAYPTYVAGAQAVDASTDPSITTSVHSLRAHGYLGDGSPVHVTSQVFQITRG